MTTPEHLLRELGITSPNEIDVEVIAWHCGLEVQYKELRSCDARIVGAGDRGVLSVDVNKSPERKRFSVAHELGHWQLHRGQIMMCRADEIDVGKKSNSAHERDADAFAAALLMPAYLFEPAAALVSKKEPWTQVAELSSIFKTSILATALRLISLGIWPGWLLSHGKHGRRWFRVVTPRLLTLSPDRIWTTDRQLSTWSLALHRPQSQNYFQAMRGSIAALLRESRFSSMPVDMELTKYWCSCDSRTEVWFCRLGRSGPLSAFTNCRVKQKRAPAREPFVAFYH